MINCSEGHSCCCFCCIPIAILYHSLYYLKGHVEWEKNREGERVHGLSTPAFLSRVLHLHLSVVSESATTEAATQLLAHANVE